jgi:signal transduction histidine kinase
MVNEYTGLGKTGETFFTKADNQGLKYLTPLRFDSAAANTFVRKKDDYATLATMGKKHPTIIKAKDYRGKKVIASSRYIPATGWTLVTKIDQQEIMAPLKKLMKDLVLINLLVIFISMVLSLILAKYFTRPLIDLSQAALEIDKGNYAKRTKVTSSNEIGNLCLSFNKMADNLQRKIEQLNSSNESLNKFAYVISHDLKSPLSSVKGLTDIMTEEAKKSGSSKIQSQMLGMIMEKTLQMEEMITNILETAKKGSSAEQQKEIIDVKVLIKNILDNIHIPPNISVNIQKDLPRICYHKISLYQIFQNLISNAIKYNNKPQGKVEITGEVFDKKIKFCVIDNGPGIKAENLDKIFSMFNKIESDREIESSGIGLSIVKKIVTENNGEIWVETEVGSGSKFFFTTPA